MSAERISSIAIKTGTGKNDCECHMFFGAKLPAADYIDALRKIARQMLHNDHLPHDMIELAANALIDRERKGTTCIGVGIGQPHAHIPFLNNKVYVGWFYPDPPITGRSLDGAPTKLLTCILTPENPIGIHLRTLAALSRFFKDKSIRNTLVESTPPESSEGCRTRILSASKGLSLIFPEATPLTSTGILGTNALGNETLDAGQSLLTVSLDVKSSMPSPDNQKATLDDHKAMPHPRVEGVPEPMLTSTVETSEEIARSNDLDVTLHGLMVRLRRVIECGAITLYIYDEQTKIVSNPPISVGVWFDEKLKVLENAPMNSIVSQMLKRKLPYMVLNVNGHEHLRNSRFAREERIQSCVVVPLHAQERMVGVMFVNYRIEHYFHAEEMFSIQHFANEAARAISNVQISWDRQKRQRQELFIRSPDFALTLSRVNSPAELGTLVAQQARVILENTIDPKDLDYPQLKPGKLKSGVVVPIIQGQRTVGTFLLGYKDGSETFSSEELPILKSLAEHMSLSLDRASRFEATRDQAFQTPSKVYLQARHILQRNKHSSKKKKRR